MSKDLDEMQAMAFIGTSNILLSSIVAGKMCYTYKSINGATVTSWNPRQVLAANVLGGVIGLYVTAKLWEKSAFFTPILLVSAFMV